MDIHNHPWFPPLSLFKTPIDLSYFIDFLFAKKRTNGTFFRYFFQCIMKKGGICHDPAGFNKRSSGSGNYVRYMPEKLWTRYTIRVYPPGTIIHQKDFKLETFGIIAKGEHRVINEFQNGNVYMIEKNEPIDFDR